MLRDGLLVLKTLSTSLSEMAGNKEDLLVLAFNQLGDMFEEKFYEAFPHNRMFTKRGCRVVHETNCAACQVLVEGDKIQSCPTNSSWKPVCFLLVFVFHTCNLIRELGESRKV